MVPLCSLHRTYTGICSHDQRQSYKQDFNREYSEYRDLHARIDIVTRQFMGLDTQLKRLHRESHKYKVKHKEIQHFTLCLEQHALTASLLVSIFVFLFVCFLARMEDLKINFCKLFQCHPHSQYVPAFISQFTAHKAICLQNNDCLEHIEHSCKHTQNPQFSTPVLGL